jgi:CheY-like chemotaxis protein
MCAVDCSGLPGAERMAVMTGDRPEEYAPAVGSPSAPAFVGAAHLEPDRALAPPVLDERPNVLVVEDDDSLARMLDDLLSDAGYRVTLARDGADGFTRAVREQPAVVLSDFMLPGMDGGQLIGKLRAHPRTRAIPVALMSSSLVARRRVPGVPFLLKPFNIADVLALLARALRGTSTLIRYGEG